jgi:NADPH:quinone reductase-like Zn-dependent oxidoreductase
MSVSSALRLGDGSDNIMKAIVQDNYGSPDVLQLKDIRKPVVKDDEVLVRVRAAAVYIGGWHLLQSVPYVMRLGIGLRRPRREIPGLDIAGQVEARLAGDEPGVGPDVGDGDRLVKPRRRGKAFDDGLVVVGEGASHPSRWRPRRRRP